MKALALATLLLVATPVVPAVAQSGPYPSRPVRIIAPFPAGSSTDILARLIAEELRKDSGGSFVVDNRPGALGSIGAAAVAKSAPDGYTLLLNSISHVQSPFLLKQAGFEPVKDFAPVSRLVNFQWLIAAANTPGLGDLKSLIAAGKAAPGKLNFAYANAGSQAGIGEFNKLAGIEAVGVGYKGMPQALTDMSTGAIHYMLVDVSVSSPLIQAGSIRGLALTSGRRSSLIPQVPTLEEAGFTGFEYSGWAGIAAPAGTPREIVSSLSGMIAVALARPEVAGKLTAIGIDPAPLPMDEYKAFMERELAVWERRIREAGIQPE